MVEIPSKELRKLQARLQELETAKSERKSAEDRIRLQSHILEIMSEGVNLIRARDNIIIYTSPGFEQMFGYEPGELVGVHVSLINALTEKDPQVVAAEISKVLTEKGEWRGEIFNVRKDGTKFWCSVNIKAFQHAEHGKVWISVHTDINERKLAEEKLKDREEKFRTIFEGSTIGMALFELNSQSITSNPALQRMLGYGPEGLTFELISELTYPEDLEVDLKLFNEMIEGKRDYYQIEKRYLRKNGMMVLGRLTVTLIRGDDDEPRFVVSMLEDITERKRLEEALRESEERFRKVFEEGPIGMVLTSRNLKFFSANPAFRQMLGYTEEEMNNRTFLEVTHPEHRITDRENVEKLWQGKIPFYRTMKRYIAKNGDIHWGSLSTSLIRGRDGKPIYALGMVEDITDRKRAEENMKNSLKEKEILLKEIHHRVKNNLQVISSLLYLQSKKLSDAQSLEVFNEGQNRIRTMVLIHEQLYRSGDLARINFEKYIYDITNSLAHSYGSKPVNCKIQAEGVYLGVDQAIPCGLMINELISNALKHAFPQGKSGQIEIDLRIDNSNYLNLTVKDNGIGFPKDLDFQNTTSLGLQIVNKLVNQLEGTIELHTNAGTEFIIKFPTQK